MDPNTQAKGDNDPVDVCEIGERVWTRGDIRQVKVLGTLAMIDEGILCVPTDYGGMSIVCTGETDWKILAIDVTDPLADQMNGIYVASLYRS